MHKLPLSAAEVEARLQRILSLDAFSAAAAVNNGLIRVDLNHDLTDGMEVKFRSPVDCSQVTGLAIYYSNAEDPKTFAFADAHGNNVGDIDHLFAENVIVKVILDLDNNMAFVQNPDTNAYLESRFNEIPKNLSNLADDAEHRTVTDSEKDTWNAKSDFSGSWNDLEDRPFGETTTTIGGYTLTWDGNTEGLTTDGSYYKVSDVILSDEEIKSASMTYNGQTMNLADVWDALVSGGLVSPESVYAEAAIFIREPNTTVFGTVYPECGIYFMNTVATGGGYVESLTVPVTEQTVTTPLDEKYIPDTIARTEYVDTQVDALNKSKADANHNHNGMYYTKSEIDNMELITVDDIDAICGASIVAASEVVF